MKLKRFCTGLGSSAKNTDQYRTKSISLFVAYQLASNNISNKNIQDSNLWPPTSDLFSLPPPKEKNLHKIEKLTR